MQVGIRGKKHSRRMRLSKLRYILQVLQKAYGCATGKMAAVKAYGWRCDMGTKNRHLMYILSKRQENFINKMKG